MLLVTVNSCDVCQGRGRVAHSKCSVCKGRGLRRESTTLSVHVERGVRHGDELLLVREGDQAPLHVPGHIVVHVVRLLLSKDEGTHINTDHDVHAENDPTSTLHSTRRRPGADVRHHITGGMLNLPDCSTLTRKLTVTVFNAVGVSGVFSGACASRWTHCHAKASSYRPTGLCLEDSRRRHAASKLAGGVWIPARPLQHHLSNRARRCRQIW